MFPKEFYNHTKNNVYTEIKGGTEREKFLEIWVVTVNNRVFARSWAKSEKSWYTAFLEAGVGQLKYGNKIINVTGKKLHKNFEIHLDISKEYLQVFSQPENLEYSEGIAKPEYFDYTMEFFFEGDDVKR